MNIRLKILLVFILILITIHFIYVFFVPFQIKMYREIEIGNKIIIEINNYFSENEKYPEDNDWKTIEYIYRSTFLNSEIEFNESTQPYFKRINNEFILQYIYGFDPPYLFYFSKTNEWEYGYPPY